MIEEAPKPLRSFYGASDRQKHDNTVKSMACPGDRPQEIFTPRPLLNAIHKVWPRIEFDPCGHPDSPIVATRVLTGIQIPKLNRDGSVSYKKNGDPRLVWSGEGLDTEWPDGTYSNPPFSDLEEWMVKAASGVKKEVMQLVPVRTHRKWWTAVASQCTAIAWLKPVTFVGFDQAFPAPLAMLYFGVEESFVDAFSSVSCHIGAGL